MSDQHPTIDDTAPEAAPDGTADETAGRWWDSFLPQTRAQTVVGALALAFLAFALGYVLGNRGASDDSPSAGSADVGFLYDMSTHHQQAITMAGMQLANGEDPGALRWARDILRAQAYEIGLMESRLGRFGYEPGDRPATAMAWMGMETSPDAMPGMASEDELDALREARGAEADALFYALMLDHHLGGVAMAEHAAEHAGDEWVVDTAAAMAAIQASEIHEMTADRETASLPENPAGHTPDHLAEAMNEHEGNDS